MYTSGSKFLGKCKVRICIDYHVLNIVDSLDNEFLKYNLGMYFAITNRTGSSIKDSLSEVDKTILKDLLSPNGRKSSLSLANGLGIPLTTIQRRRKRLEKEFLESNYSLNLDKFGWRRVDFFISTKNGKTDDVAIDLFGLNEVTFVGKSIGAHTIDLRAETIVKDNEQLLDLLEKIKGMGGVTDAIWSEIVKVIGKKRSIPSNIIDQL
jgi:DNA-binding Lrp family transcriptional regulator